MTMQYERSGRKLYMRTGNYGRNGDYVTLPAR